VKPVPPWIDLSHPLADGMPSWSQLPPPRVTHPFVLGPHHANITQLSLQVHSGTHVDAPCHFLAGAASMEQIPVERFMGPGWVCHVHRGRRGEVTARDLEQAVGRPEPGVSILLCTGYGRLFGEPEYYGEYPYLTGDAVEWLIRHRVNAIAVDTPTPDAPPPLRGPGFAYPAHKRLMERDVLILENVNGRLEALSGPVDVLFMPLAIVGSDGSPVRLLARARA
jgi:kynurenine formamidase